jgi:hypothetical protein
VVPIRSALKLFPHEFEEAIAKAAANGNGNGHGNGRRVADIPLMVR